MSDPFSSGVLGDDNGFEKVHHADISGGSPAAAQGGAQDLMFGESTPPQGDGYPVLAPAPAPIASSSFQISSGVTPSSSGSSMPPEPVAPVSPPVASVSPSSSVLTKAEETKTAGTCCSFVKNLDPRVLDLIYWRDVKKTGVVFSSLLILLLSLALFSVLSVVAYLSLVILTITLTFRLYKNVLSAVQKTGDGHPFKEYIDMELSMSDERVRKSAEELIKTTQMVLNTLKRLFLIEDIVDSLKFGLLLWLLTYIGAWFNGMTLIILVVIDVFTLPKFYDVYKVQIDENLALLKSKLQQLIKQVQEKLPLPGKKKQA